MDRYMIKSYGTPEELKLIEEVCKDEGLMDKFDENGEMSSSEDYTFGRRDIDSFVRRIISIAPDAKLFMEISYNDDVSGQDRFSLAEYDTEKLVYKDTGWYYPPIDIDYLCYEDEEDEFEDEYTTSGGYHYVWRKGYPRPDEQIEEGGDGFEWYGKMYKWDYVEETVIKGVSEVKIKAIADNVSEVEDFGALLLAHLPIEIGFDDIKTYFQGEIGNRTGTIVIETIKHGIGKTEVDKFAESLGVVMPDSRYVVYADFKDGDSYKYVRMDGEFLCGREIERDNKYERAEITLMTEEEKKKCMFDENEL